MPKALKRIDPGSLNLKEQVVAINRVTKVVKGGKNMSFSALVVIGDPSAKVKEATDQKIAELKQEKTAGTLTADGQSDLAFLETHEKHAHKPKSE